MPHIAFLINEFPEAVFCVVIYSHSLFLIKTELFLCLGKYLENRYSHMWPFLGWQHNWYPPAESSCPCPMSMMQHGNLHSHGTYSFTVVSKNCHSEFRADKQVSLAVWQEHIKELQELGKVGKMRQVGGRKGEDWQWYRGHKGVVSATVVTVISCKWFTFLDPLKPAPEIVDACLSRLIQAMQAYPLECPLQTEVHAPVVQCIK